ncbi:non-hydrolyzing UDP-N-acetylglucosamine 2-epimerase [uncultured Gelidibacter sp.]|uniref:non-hydrolyzing UDP-N-acetylglucosamine 2-epimerase n=1 Tax=uncultured Gelidibacter sp. TaxID=259318 RepID=UPI002602972F|nr:UDP-N-acetylglucosamine 2-epimerase (non-hydrolyzing) [uncultured Gelidibacter sp.]
MKIKKVAVIFGTRPEAIKMAPIILELKKHANINLRICVTGQHREMLDQVLEIFDIKPDFDLELMTPNQTLSDLTAKAISSIDKFLKSEKPDLVLIQGDTTTVFSAAMASFYNKIPVGHVEAGLRTGNLYSPWPEEANRVLTTKLTKLHFAPTELNSKNLLEDGVSNDDIYITGNTVIDSLFIVLKKLEGTELEFEGLPNRSLTFLGDKKMILITGHRRENFGEGFENICYAIAELARLNPDINFIYPVHLNPNVREPVNRILKEYDYTENKEGNVFLIPPQSYMQFIALMNRSYIILTDSGGVQEEAPSLGKPVLVMRDTTERPEAVIAGTVKLVGNETKEIVGQTQRLIQNVTLYEKFSKSYNPYGDGKAAKKIVQIILREI